MDRFIKLNNSINTVGYPNVIEDENGNLVYNAIPDYLYFTALEDMTIKYSGSYLQYSTDCKTWISLNANTYSDTIKKGTTIYIRTSSSVSSLGQFTVTGRFNIGGSLKELLSSATEKKYRNLFSNNTRLVDASGLVLYEYGKYIYSKMFSGCTSLVKAPDIFVRGNPISGQMLSSMFAGCTSLTTPPTFIGDISGSGGTNRAYYTCSNMFSGCTALTETPWLTASFSESDDKYCYQNMFNGCTALNKVKMLSLTAPSDTCTKDWLKSVSQNGVFIKNSEAEWDVIGTNGIPEGWEIKQYDFNTGKTFIKFYINDSAFIADDNMTWTSWVSSDYNTIGLAVNDDNTVYNETGTLKLNDTPVLSTDKIKYISGGQPYNI